MRGKEIGKIWVENGVGVLLIILYIYLYIYIYICVCVCVCEGNDKVAKNMMLIKLAIEKL